MAKPKFAAALVTSIAASMNEKAVQIQWTAQAEDVSEGFEVYRMVDQGIWEEIGFVSIAQDDEDRTEFSFSDNVTPMDRSRHTVYYRVGYDDKEGLHGWSQATVVRLTAPKKAE
ncbi:MAG: hypothetical protein IPP94_13130 [Ignavibacteria bacterium]|nr:hypothetical protein [Ignavibacteria bacterium]